MTFKEKMACSTLKDEQHRQIIQNSEYFLSLSYTRDELEHDYKWLVTFIYTLETMSFICPREREKYLVYIHEKYEDKLEEIKKRS